jgi:high-affinity nickel permease
MSYVLCVYDLSFLAFARLIYTAGPFIRFAYWCMVFPGFVFYLGFDEYTLISIYGWSFD